MPRSEGLAPDFVRLGLFVPDVAALFRVVAEDLSGAGLVRDIDAVVRALTQRESVQSTALGAGIAIPHARSACCDAPRFHAVRLGMALDFVAPDDLPVDLAFVLLSPPSNPGEHLKYLARLARTIEKPGVVASLRCAPDEAAFRRILESEAAAA